MATKLKIGQRVKMRRSHDKAVEFTGTVVGISATEPVAEIQTEAGNGSIVHLECAHVDDITVLDEPAAPPAA
jgi:hypothetical protein